MTIRLMAGGAAVGILAVLAGCGSPLDRSQRSSAPSLRPLPDDASPSRHASAFRAAQPAPNEDASPVIKLGPDAAPDDYIRYALFNSPGVEAAYQRWRAEAERIAQVGALPDPRLSVGFFLDEVETRTGPQQARIGASQSFPWPGTLADRQQAARFAALSEWRMYEAAQLEVTERVVDTLHELAFLDAAIAITRENLDLLRSFEEVIRVRYRVGAGTHPELVRIQLELGQLDDRLAQLIAMRPAYTAELNATLYRPIDAEVATINDLPGRVAELGGPALAELASASNPSLLALDERAEQQRVLADLARKEGRPDFTVGLDYIVTNDAMNSSIPESGDDPILLSFGFTVPIWRDKYNAQQREAIASRLAVSRERQDQASRIAAGIQRAWFEHTDAHRRVGLYENTLIPKAEESIRASLAGFRTGEIGFLDLLDTERSLLEFALAAARARADRGQALATLHRLAGEPIPTRPARAVSKDAEPSADPQTPASEDADPETPQ